jgi:hypothetical protein
MSEYFGELVDAPVAKPKAKINPALVNALTPAQQVMPTQAMPTQGMPNQSNSFVPVANVLPVSPIAGMSPKDQAAFRLSEANRIAATKMEAEKIKPIPEKINASVLENHQALNKLDDALELLELNKDAIGLKGNLGQTVLNRLDPKGIDTRAAIADIGSIVLHDRSGASVTIAESPRLLPFIPTPSDTYEAAKNKLARMRKYASEEQDALKATYSKEQGFKDFPVLPARVGINKPPVGAPLEAKKAPDGKWYSPDPTRPGKYVQWGD